MNSTKMPGAQHTSEWAIRNLDTFTKNGSTLHLYGTGGIARISARTRNWTVQPYVYTGPTELDEFLNGQVCKFGNCFFQVSNLQKTQGGTA